MCGDIYTSIEAPESALARLLKNELGVEINQQALRLFIRYHWEEVSGLSHTIHGSGQLEKEPTEKGLLEALGIIRDALWRGNQWLRSTSKAMRIAPVDINLLSCDLKKAYQAMRKSAI